MSIAQKQSIGKNLNQFAERKILEQIELDGKIIPASIVSANSGIVVVKVELNNIAFTIPELTVPLFGPEYVRYPLQPGDSGILIPASTYIDHISGQGGGSVPDLTTPPNLSALTFLPIGNTAWQNVDLNVVTIYGPNGVTLRDSGSNCEFKLTPTSITMTAPNSVTVTSGGTTFAITPSGWSLSGTNGSLADSAGATSPAIMKNVWTALLSWANTHVHTNGNGGSNTGASTTTLSGNIVQ